MELYFPIRFSQVKQSWLDGASQIIWTVAQNVPRKLGTVCKNACNWIQFEIFLGPSAASGVFHLWWSPNSLTLQTFLGRSECSVTFTHSTCAIIILSELHKPHRQTAVGPAAVHHPVLHTQPSVSQNNGWMLWTYFSSTTQRRHGKPKLVPSIPLCHSDRP